MYSDPLVETIGQRLRAARKMRGWTQCEVAKQTQHIRQAMISMYEAGKVIPSLYTAAYLARGYRVSVDYLLGLSDDPERGGITWSKTS